MTLLQRRHPRGYTMTEILVVIGIIVLLLAMGVPAFNLIRGGRSVDSAENQITALLGRARATALGIQKMAGIMFVKDLASNRFYVVEVIEGPYPAGGTRQVYLDLADSEFLPLPPGVGVQTLNNKPTGGVDGYLGFNNNTIPLNQAGTPAAAAQLQFYAYGGVILFNGQGQVVSRTYGFVTTTGGTSPTDPIISTRMDRLLIDPGQTDSTQYAHNPGHATSDPPESALGFVLFDREQFTANGSEGDPQLDTQFAPANETAEEAWIDSNGLALMVNRYNGTLTRAQ